MVSLSNLQLPKVALYYAMQTMGCRCTFILDTEKNPFSGGECVIFAFEAQCPTKEKIGIRLEHTPNIDKVKREVRHLEAINGLHIPHVPVLLGHSMSTEPSPFIALKWANGSALNWTDSSPEVEVRDRVLQTVAQVNMDLLNVQETGMLGYCIMLQLTGLMYHKAPLLWTGL